VGKKTKRPVKVYHRKDGRPYIRLKREDYSETTMDVDEAIALYNGEEYVKQHSNAIAEVRNKKVIGKHYQTMQPVEYPSILAAADAVCVNPSSISRAVLNGTLCKDRYWYEPR